MNAYERSARERKAQRLATVFYDMAMAACMESDQRTGKHRTHEQLRAQIAGMAHVAPPELWVRTAYECKINIPSLPAIHMAAEKVIERCSAKS